MQMKKKAAVSTKTEVTKNTRIVSGFPGVGKSEFFKIASGTITVQDSDSSKFDKAHFPDNYIEHIKLLHGKVDYILVSSHKEVREAMLAAGLPFTCVYPDASLKHEYLDRYKQRGSPQAFIDLVEANWFSWLEELNYDKDRYATLVLKKGQYLSDVLNDPQNG